MSSDQLNPDLKTILHITQKDCTNPVYEWDEDAMKFLHVLVENYVNTHTKHTVHLGTIEWNKILQSSHETPLQVSFIQPLHSFENRKSIMRSIGHSISVLDKNLTREIEDHNLVTDSVRSDIIAMIVPPERLKAKWDQIIGNADAVRILKRDIILPVAQPKYMSNAEETSRGVLMYGPPGTGKTLLAKATGASLFEYDPEFAYRTKFMNVASSGLLGRYLGQTERNIATMFEISSEFVRTKNGKYEKTTEAADIKRMRTIIFIDEVDAIALPREAPTTSQSQRSATDELIIRISAIRNPGIKLIATTNYPWKLDSAFRRRFTTQIYVTLPTPQDRWELLDLYLGKFETMKLQDLHPYLKEDTQKARDLKVSFLKSIRSVQNMNVHQVFLTLGLIVTKYPFPDILVKTALFTNADIEQLTIDLINSSILFGFSHWWKPSEIGEGYVLTSVSTEKKPEEQSWRSLLDLPPNSIKEPPKPVTEAISAHLRYLKPSVSLEDLYRLEWYALSNEFRNPPPIAWDQKIAPDTTDLWTLFVYHMRLFTDRYAQELAIQMWRLIMKATVFQDATKRLEYLQLVFSLRRKDIAWFSALSELRAVIVETVEGSSILTDTFRWFTGKSHTFIRYPELYPQFKALHNEYFKFLDM